MSFLRQQAHLAVALIAIFLFCGQIQVAFADFDCNSVSGIPISECEALVSFYNSTGGESWWDKSGWLMTNTPCSWRGISCNDGHVSRISLILNHLTGSIPSQLGNLSNLIWLSLVPIFLQVHLFEDSSFSIYMVTAFDSFFKSQTN